MKKDTLFVYFLLTFAFLISSMLPNFHMQKAFARDLPDTFYGTTSPVMTKVSNVHPQPLATELLYSSLFQPIPPAINQTTIEDHNKQQQDELSSRSVDFTKSSIHSFEYTIQPGDSIQKIANSYHVDAQQLIAYNNISNPGLVYAGKTLQIPVNVMDGLAGSMKTEKTIVCTLTAYTSGYESTGKNPGDAGYGITSTGTHAVQGKTIAVDPHVIPYGTRVFIPGLGIRVAEDTGGAIKGTRIDVYFNNLNTALSFGVKRNVPVYILPNQDTFAESNSGNSSKPSA